MSFFPRRFVRPRHAALNTAFLCGTLAAGLLSQTLVSAAPAPARRVVLSGHASRTALASPMIGVEPATATMSLAISLPLRNQALLEDTLRRLYDPADPLYKQFLTLDQFTAQFGPTQAQYDNVTKFLAANGLSVSQTFANRTQIDVTGPVSRVNAAFGIQMKRFLAVDGTTFRASTTNVSIPIALAGSISSVTGLDGSLKATPNYKVLSGPVSDSAADPLDSVLAPDATQPTQGTGLGNTFSYSDVKTAYNLKSTTLDGTGQTVGLVEFDSLYNPKDILRNSAAIGVRPRIQNVFVSSGGAVVTQANGNALEIDLDIDEAASLAPKALIDVYMVPFNDGDGALDEFQQIISDNKAKSISASYGFGAEDPAGLDPTFDIPLNNLLKQMAALGISFFISSGDSGSSTSRSTYVRGVDRFGALPYSCTVGGTQLSVAVPKSNEAYLSETTWNIDNTPSGGAGGGGFSINWPIPDYQTQAAAAASPRATVSTTKRNIPDVSLNASAATGYLVYVSDYPGATPGTYTAGYFRVGGTSASAPLWAGFAALVNQNSLRNGGGLLGFPNPTLYSFGPGGSSAGLYSTVFHDVNDLSTNSVDPVAADTQFLATTGFDDATGLGSFNGQPLIQALSGPTP